jgi:peptidoglycan/LPS O-acetylase OafA/YrhL
MDGWRRVHRILAVVFLLTIPPAAYYSFNGDPAAPHPLVYAPLFPLFVMIITGTWLLVRPWIKSWRAPKS